MHKRVSAEDLLTLFHLLDKRLVSAFYSFKEPNSKFDIVTIGGTALGLLKLKDISKDMDLLVELSSIGKVCGKEPAPQFAERLVRFIKEYFDGSAGIGADVSYEGLKSWNLIDFEMKKELLPEQFACFTLATLDPIDVCITKLPRYDLGDIQDVTRVFLVVKPSPQKLEERFLAYISRLKNPKSESLLRYNYEQMQMLLLKLKVQ